MIRIILPFHLRNLAHVGSEITLEVEAPATLRSVLDALEARYPMLRGAIRDHDTQQRRPFLRFFACEEDLSPHPPHPPPSGRPASGRCRVREGAVYCHWRDCGRVAARLLSRALRSREEAVPSFALS